VYVSKASGTVIPNAMRDLLNVVRCLHWEILHCVQDDEIPGFIEKLTCCWMIE
jgi:hypothetical protein